MVLRLPMNVGRWELRLVQLAQEEVRLRDNGRWTHGRDDYLGVLDRATAADRMTACERAMAVRDAR